MAANSATSTAPNILPTPRRSTDSESDFGACDAHHALCGSAAASVKAGAWMYGWSLSVMLLRRKQCQVTWQFCSQLTSLRFSRPATRVMPPPMAMMAG